MRIKKNLKKEKYKFNKDEEDDCASMFQAINFFFSIFLFHFNKFNKSHENQIYERNVAALYVPESALRVF